MTNREWVNTLDNEMYLHVLLDVLPILGKGFRQSRTWMVNWLDAHHNPELMSIFMEEYYEEK